MKGLSWFRVMSDIAWDGDMEHQSDAAFRTFFELIGYSAYHLTDGVIPLKDAQKRCNSRRFKCAIGELESAGQIENDGENLHIVNYPKYQQTREEVESGRERDRSYVRAYRERGKAPCKTPQSKRQSKNTSPLNIPIEEERQQPTGYAENAGGLVAYFLDQSKARGRAVTSPDKGQFARYAKEVLDQGIAFFVAKAAVDKMLDKTLPHRLLGQLCNEVKVDAPITDEDHARRIAEIKARF